MMCLCYGTHPGMKWMILELRDEIAFMLDIPDTSHSLERASLFCYICNSDYLIKMMRNERLPH